MGLNLTAVSKGYHYSKKAGREYGKRYSDTDIGYFGFMRFRNDLLKYASAGRYTDIVNDQLFGKSFSWCWSNKETHTVCMKREELDEDRIDEEYLEKLEYLKKYYPKVYAIYPFVVHCDCEGEIPLEQVKMFLPVVKEFYNSEDYSKERDSYGYSSWGYEFLEDFIIVLEEVVLHQGKLRFS